MHVAFIGVGNMGRPMLANLLKKGFTATAYDIVPAALDAAAALGAARASSPAEAAAAGDLVITILPSSAMPKRPISARKASSRAPGAAGFASTCRQSIPG